MFTNSIISGSSATHFNSRDKQYKTIENTPLHRRRNQNESRNQVPSASQECGRKRSPQAINSRSRSNKYAQNIQEDSMEYSRSSLREHDNTHLKNSTSSRKVSAMMT